MILTVACVFILGVFIFVKPAIMILVRKQLGNVFIQSRVSVGRCVIQPTRGLSFFDIEIKRQGVYDIKVKEAVIQYSLFSMLKAGSLKLSLKGARVYLSTPGKGIGEFAGYLNLGKGNSLLMSIEVSDLALDLNTLDLTAKANLSLGLNLFTQSLDYLDFEIDIFKMLGVQLENASLKLGSRLGQGDFSLAKLKYDKLSVTDIKGKAKLEGMVVLLYGVSARALDADIEGDLNLKIGKETQYLANLKFAHLDIERFVRDFNLGEKFEMTGRISGDLKLQGKGAQIEILGGSFSTLQPGGTLVIRDTKFLENMARNTRQPVNLLMESFKNYRYNTGLMSLDFEDGNIMLKIELEGEAGKRNLSVTVHDFKLWKEEQ